MPGCSWRGHLREVHIHYCPDVLRGDTCEEYIFINSWVFLKGTPATGTYGFHYCLGLLGGDTYDGYIVHRFHELRATVKAKTVNREVQLQALVDGKRIIITESTVRRDLQLEDAEGVDCLPNATIFEQLILMGAKTTTWNEFSSTMASEIICLAINQKFNFSKYIFENEAIYKELDDSLVRAATTASSLEAEQDNGNIIKTRSKATPSKAGSQGTTSGGGPKRQETMGDTTARTRFESVSKLSNDPLFIRARVESSKDEESLGADASKQGRINVIDVDEDITLVNDHVDAFVVEQSGNVVEEVVAVIDAASIILVSGATKIDVEGTLAQALAELKSAKPKADKVVIQEPEQGTTTTPTTIISVPKPPQDKGKGIMIEEPVVEQVKPMKRLEQIRLDEELAFKLQAKEEEEERLTREKAQQIEEANIA
ncbi:hypothetical protein Tco_0680408 [Tanacetum coccineum]|uniref:Uncharacterized protein n=1 Tax=Tanacetum coccineum TaxID=301880 RepID=A0ABQ4XKF4_9ASTR